MNRSLFPANGLSGNVLLLLVAIFLVAVGNLSFFANVLKSYPPAAGNAAALLALALTLAGVTVLLLAVLCWGRATQPVLVVILLLSSAAAYFMDSYGVVFSDDMLRNALQTNPAEARDLLSAKLLAYLGLLGVLPAFAVAKVKLRRRGFKAEAMARGKLLAGVLLLMVVTVLAFGSFFASFVREHKPLRAYANPGYYLYSVVKLLHGEFAAKADTSVAPLGVDAHTPAGDQHQELVVLVVGETARADRFSLNGYGRDTSPLLSRAGVVSFTNFHACGTSTAVSVPCMFALGGSAGKPGKQENLLDVLQHAGVNVFWMDNNSDSKGVALRVPYQDYKSPETNPVCDVECRDVGMLAPLKAYIDAHPQGDIFVVLHQMGNHGPAYFKRYPPEFEKFKPACQNNDLNQCSREEIDNAYDNAILYTDYFLAQLIELLKQYGSQYETALFYLSDHGESLGESGVYLHGLPKAIAPVAQLHVPAIMWFGNSFDDIDVPALQKRRAVSLTHDNLFHTALGFLEIETSIYRPEMDILSPVRRPEGK